MAKNTLNRKYSNVIIDLDELTWTEMPKKEGVEENTFKFLDELARFAGQDKRVDITINEVSEHLPSEEE